MFQINENYKNLKESYLFSEIAKKIKEYTQGNPDKKVIRMGIGDVTRPICREAVNALKNAADEMGNGDTFRGYGPEQGYDFLKEKISEYYLKKNVALDADEIFISDGAKSDLGNILDLFSAENTVLVPDPVYPVYVDTNIMAGRRIVYTNANEENSFLPMPDHSINADIIYICSPNNPTGSAYNRDQLKEWVGYAKEKGAIILYDAAYEAFITDKDLPGSIYEIDGAKEVAIEFCSFSKTAGFTGLRLGYTVVPKVIKSGDSSLNRMWLRRQTTKFNGVSYVTQRAGAAIFTEQGQKEIRESIDYYRKNAQLMTDTFTSLGIWFTGGKNSPYVWIKCPKSMNSWEFFDYLLKNAQVVGTPGAGFGKNGEGYFRLTAFNTYENTKEAMERIRALLG